MSYLYSLIPKDRYITREELCRLTGWSDRKVRYEINLLRKNPRSIPMSVEVVVSHVISSTARTL